MRTAGAFALPREDALFSRAWLCGQAGRVPCQWRPVIASATGDVELYLKDDVDAFLVHDCTVESFAMRLREALSDAERAAAVGRAGRQTAIRCCKVRDAGPRLVTFFDSLGVS